jgi:hypothetical protein
LELSIEWVDQDREVVECEVQYAGRKTRFPLPAKEAIGSDGIHVLDVILPDKCGMGKRELEQLVLVAKNGEATITLFSERAATNTVEIDLNLNPY